MKKINNLSNIYKTQVQSGHIQFDTQQADIISQLQSLTQALVQKETFFHRIFSRFSLKKKPAYSQGIYLWGSVGAGKTYLMDLFFQNLPIEQKLRIHFHHFMQEVHESLTSLQGQPDPLRIVARHFAMRTRVLCFDEFIVNDIADAMILGRLISFLLERGITLVATSNIEPDRLYWDGLQREQFLPAIALIKQHCQIVQLSNQQDYRWRSLQQAGIYFTPLDSAADENMHKCLNLYAHGSEKSNMPLIIAKRPILTRYQGKSVVWFDFKAICSSPRSQIDYLEIAQRFNVVLISNLPIIDPNDEITACYWIELVDIFYDNHVLLIISAEAPLKDIYPSGKKSFEFERTLSRLIEMQSEEYLCASRREFIKPPA